MEPNQPSMLSPESSNTAPKAKTSYGPLVGLILITIVIVVGAFYLLNQRLSETTPPPKVDEGQQ